MTDLILPLVIIIIMYLLIDALDTILPLIMLGLLFIPVSWVFTYQLNGGVYTTLFNGEIYSSNIPMFNELLAMIMFSVPLMAFFKMVFLRRLIVKGDLEDENIDE